jgi:hypothetical protein
VPVEGPSRSFGAGDPGGTAHLAVEQSLDLAPVAKTDATQVRLRVC